MTVPGWNDPAEDERNPHRVEERHHARDEMEARLRERNIMLRGNESDEQVLAIVNAVEDFEAQLARIGADSFVNTPESSQPDDDRLVVPMRRDDESVESYVRRIRDAAAALENG